MLAYLLALAIVTSPAGDKIESAVKSYVEKNFSNENIEYQYDFNRINLNFFPADFDSVKVLRIGKNSPVGITVFTLGVYKNGELVKSVPVSISITMLVEALVTTVPINSGEKFHELDIAKRVISGRGQLPLTDPQKLADKQARTYIPAGSMILPSMCENIPVIKPGDKINIVFETEMMRLTAEGLARQRGGIGDMIRVTNLGSKKVIRAEVVDSTTVAIR